MLALFTAAWAVAVLLVMTSLASGAAKGRSATIAGAIYLISNAVVGALMSFVIPAHVAVTATQPLERYVVTCDPAISEAFGSPELPDGRRTLETLSCKAAGQREYAALVLSSCTLSMLYSLGLLTSLGFRKPRGGQS